MIKKAMLLIILIIHTIYPLAVKGARIKLSPQTDRIVVQGVICRDGQSNFIMSKPLQETFDERRRQRGPSKINESKAIISIERTVENIREGDRDFEKIPGGCSYMPLNWKDGTARVDFAVSIAEETAKLPPLPKYDPTVPHDPFYQGRGPISRRVLYGVNVRALLTNEVIGWVFSGFIFELQRGDMGAWTLVYEKGEFEAFWPEDGNKNTITLKKLDHPYKHAGIQEQGKKALNGFHDMILNTDH